METAKILTNFRAPIDLRNHFDQVCKLSRRTRSSVLIELMSGYVLEKSGLIIQQIEDLRSLNRILTDQASSSSSPATAQANSSWDVWR